MKNFFIGCLILFSFVCSGQSIQDSAKSGINNGFFSKKATSASFVSKTKFGLSVGYGLFQFVAKQDFSSHLYQDTLKYVTTAHSPEGFEVAVSIEKRLSNQISFRGGFATTFSAPELFYFFSIGGGKNVAITNMGFSFPLHFLFQTRGVNSRIYCLGGPSVFIGLKSRTKEVEPFELKRFDIPIEVGVGFIKRFKLFFLSSELKFGKGWLDQKRDNGTVYTRALQKLTIQNIMFKVAISGN